LRLMPECLEFLILPFANNSCLIILIRSVAIDY
jgi:hypothetical protein